MTQRKGKVVWFTGMSGSGKSTLANHLNEYALSKNIKSLLIDGDAIRNQYSIKMGFTYDDVKKNNLQIAKICKENAEIFSLVLVAVISPYSDIRAQVKKYLDGNYYLVFCNSSIESLRKRDVKGLYEKADRKEIDNLIGYSLGSIYEKPADPYLKLNTSNEKDLESNKHEIRNLLKTLIIE